MGRKMRGKQSSDETGTGNNQGCAWGMLHIMKYHHWHYVKKRLVYKKRGNNKNGAGNHGNCTDSCSFPNIQGNDAKMEKTTPAEEKTNPLSPTSKASVKARIRARIAEEMAKTRGRYNRTTSYPLRSQLTRTESIHHFEPPLTIDPIAEMVLSEASPRPVPHGNKESSYSEKPSNSVSNNCAECSPVSATGDPTPDHVPVDENQKDEPLRQEQLDNDIVQDMLEKKLIHVKELDADSSGHQKEYLEALDIINVNKELLVKILHDPGSPLVQHFQNQQAVSAKMSLTKAESFPMPGSTGKGDSEPTSKLKSKHEPKDGSSVPKPAWSTSLKYANERSVPSISDHNIETSSSTSHPRLESTQGENPVAVKRFKDLRQKIKHVIKESKQERRMISMDAVLHKIPHGKKLTKELEQEIVSHSKDPALHREGNHSPTSSYGSDHSVSPLKKTKMHHMRRISSFDASQPSLDRYRRLYETTSFNKEANFQPSSERLKVRTEDSGSPFQSSLLPKVTKSLGRIFSLPDIESYYQSEESPDGFPGRLLFKTGGDEKTSRKSRFSEQKTQFSEGSENELKLDLPIEVEVQENLNDATEINAVTRDKVESTLVMQDETSSKVATDTFEQLPAGNSVAHPEHDTEPCVAASVKVAGPLPVLVPNINDVQDISSPRKSSQSEENLAAGNSVSHTEKDTEPPIEASTSVADHLPAYMTNIIAVQDISSPRRCSKSESKDNLDSKQVKEPDIDTANEISRRFNTEEVETPRKHPHYDMSQVQVDQRDMIEFNYVRDVLELSGLNGNEGLGTWHADDPPVCPLVYEGVEGCFVLDPDCVGNKEDGECDHLLLFDLINEVLMEIYGRSHNYCPRALSSLCDIRLMPAGHRVLKEVWTLISWYLSLRPDVDQSLDYVVSNDLAKNDGWMNLQFDSECIGIELEDLIFDELLEEAIWD
ncbi:uncharacterized protein LOC126796772 [Argentina anserina]|uniref:uncharacterized protein LOC126796772 n=1 Tax=Argentina anserina TaxID=57926 RepID=UPI0021764486|nr:uncharacterized protein LOC126796772 [Potentilla anserina]